MGGDHRGGCDFHHMEEGLVSNVGYVDHDAEPVHLCDHLVAEGAETLPRVFLGVRGITDQVVLGVAERHIANAAIVEVLQILQIVFNGCTVLDTQGQGKDTVFEIGPDLCY